VKGGVYLDNNLLNSSLFILRSISDTSLAPSSFYRKWTQLDSTSAKTNL